MNRALSYYYLDEPLSAEEQEFAEASLLGNDSRFKTGATALTGKRIPNLLPVLVGQGLSSDDITNHTQSIKNNLRKAGIRGDGGKQVLFVLPKEIFWASMFQLAIYEETGFYPYTFKRWVYTETETKRGEPSILDAHGLTFGKDD